jgi:hypothetical protein
MPDLTARRTIVTTWSHIYSYELTSGRSSSSDSVFAFLRLGGDGSFVTTTGVVVDLGSFLTTGVVAADCLFVVADVLVESAVGVDSVLGSFFITIGVVDDRPFIIALDAAAFCAYTEETVDSNRHRRQLPMAYRHRRPTPRYCVERDYSVSTVKLDWAPSCSQALLSMSYHWTCAASYCSALSSASPAMYWFDFCHCRSDLEQ